MSKEAIVIGAGFSGLSTAAYLAKDGYKVKVLEKNSIVGGRARNFKTDEGFLFDMGPSWYWLPDVFEDFFADFGHKVSDFYELKRLDPSYRVFFKDEPVDVPAYLDDLKKMLEKYETGSGAKLDKFLKEAKFKYGVAVDDLVHKPGLSLLEFVDMNFVTGPFKGDLLCSIRKHIQKFFKDPKICTIMEFPVLFLGATAENTPALYSFMNYADLGLGTWYPMGGMNEIAQAMQKVCIEQGVEFEFDTTVNSVEFNDKTLYKLKTNKGDFAADYFVASCDYEHFDKSVLPKEKSNYSDKYWDSRTMSPSGLIFYLGVNKKVKNLLHHNLFFDESFDVHAEEIYENPQWPSKPLFYVSATSKTDDTAPEGMENLFILVPVASGLEDTEATREKYFKDIMQRLEEHTGEKIEEHIIYKRSYAHKNFKEDYNAFKGNAYGLANTLRQTHILKPSIKNKKVKNLFYTGQLTVPGPGVPPSIISGKVVAKELAKMN
jgi:phytoene desaturase